MLYSRGEEGGGGIEQVGYLKKLNLCPYTLHYAFSGKAMQKQSRGFANIEYLCGLETITANIGERQRDGTRNGTGQGTGWDKAPDGTRHGMGQGTGWDKAQDVTRHGWGKEQNETRYGMLHGTGWDKERGGTRYRMG